jgi:hypothetical protein
MSLDLLLVAFVREAATLIAAAATRGGARTSLAHLDDRLFHGLAQELQSLNVRRRVSADMLGMAPRAYLRKLRRVDESVTDRGRCLWEAMYEYVATQGSVTHAALLERFHWDDQEALRGVLSELRDTGIISSEGRGAQTVYRIASKPELEARLRGTPDGTDDLVWTFIYHEGPVTRAELERHGIKMAEVDRALAQLLATRRIAEVNEHGETRFRAVMYSIPPGAGWEGAILDHFHAVVKALGMILKHPDRPAAASTYKFDVWPGHPMAEEAKELFREFRRRASELRERVDAYNSESERRPLEPVTLYFGLCKEPAVTENARRSASGFHRKYDASDERAVRRTARERHER